jgi:hypothetical protein
VLNVAQAGALVILNVNALLSASAAVGVKSYTIPGSTKVAGVPAIVGCWFAVEGGFVDGGGLDVGGGVAL